MLTLVISGLGVMLVVQSVNLFFYHYFNIIIYIMMRISSSCQFPVDPSLITVGTVYVPQSSIISMFFGISHLLATMCTFVSGSPCNGKAVWTHP